jgi:hypothetical protein
VTNLRTVSWPQWYATSRKSKMTWIAELHVKIADLLQQVPSASQA